MNRLANQVGEPPNGWEWATIGLSTKNFDGKRIPVKAKDRVAMQGPYAYYGASGVIDSINDYLFDGDYLLITEDGNLLSGSARIAYLVSGKFWVNNHAHVVQTVGNLPLRYLEAYANFVSLEGYVTGTTRPKLTQAALNRIPLPLPPLPEQHRIVAEIEKQFTRLDASVAALKRVQANLKRYRASVLKAACEGKLVPTEAELARSGGRDYEPGDRLLERILAERRARRESEEKRRGQYKEPAAPDTSDLPELPEGWVWATLPQLGELNRGKSKHRPRNDPRLLGGPYPFVQTGDIRHSQGLVIHHSQTYTGFGLAQSRLWPSGTLCITIAANIAETGILSYPACFPDSVVGFVCNNSSAITKFLEFFVRTERRSLERFAPATAQKNINLQVLSELAIPLPPLAEQCRIVADVERRLSVIQQAEATVEASLKRAERLRQSILKQAFSGKLVPQDPNDEPASALLERIRAERESARAADAAKRKHGRRHAKPAPAGHLVHSAGAS